MGGQVSQQAECTDKRIIGAQKKSLDGAPIFTVGGGSGSDGSGGEGRISVRFECGGAKGTRVRIQAFDKQLLSLAEIRIFSPTLLP